MARTSRKREEAALTSVLEARDRPGEREIARANSAPERPIKTTPRPLRPRDEFTEPSQQPQPERPLQGHVDLAKWPRVKGWVWDPSSPGERIRLDLAAGGTCLLTAAASVSRPDIGMVGIGDGLHGFEIDLSEAGLTAGRHVVTLRCADSGTELPGSPIILDVPTEPIGSGDTAGEPGPSNRTVGEGEGRAPAARSQALATPMEDSRAAAAAAKPLRAFVDQVLGNEISGWVMLSEQPSRRCVVALREGRGELSRAVASQFRPDLLAAGVGDGRHGFSLAVPILDGDAHFLHVVEIETGLTLTEEPIRWRSAPSQDEASAGHLSGNGRGEAFSSHDELSSQPERLVGKAVTELAAEPEYPARLSAADLPDPAVLIDDLLEQASAFLGKAVRPIPENLQGYVEFVSVDPSGLVWIGGWIRQGNLLEFSAGISEAGAAALPAAVLLSCYRRDDLPDGSVGFIGLLHSDWRPTSSSSEFLLVFGVEGRLHIKRHNPLRFLLGSELLEHLDAIGSRWTAGCRVDALHRALKSGLSWLPIPAEKLGFPLNLSVDRLIVVPTYGCFVEGWILSPVKRVASLRLRLGSQVTRCDPRSLYWKPRPDLADAFPASGPLLERAGFVGVFPGGELPEDFAQPVLNVRFDDGTSLNHMIPFDALASLGNAADLSEIGRLYPAMHQEPFFSGWAMAVRGEARLLNRGCVPFAVEPTEAALVFTVPADRCDAFLLFEELRQRLGQDLMPTGFVFIANRNSCRAETVALFGAMARDADWPCSLFLMDDTRYALHALPEVFSQTRMQRFVFIADSVLLTKSGWRDALEALLAPEPQLTFLEVERIGTFGGDFAEGPSTECFGWSTSAFIWWEKNAPGFFGGYYRDNGLGLDAPNPKRCLNAAVRAKQVAHDAIADAINAVGFA